MEGKKYSVTLSGFLTILVFQVNLKFKPAWVYIQNPSNKLKLGILDENGSPNLSGKLAEIGFWREIRNLKSDGISEITDIVSIIRFMTNIVKIDPKAQLIMCCYCEPSIRYSKVKRLKYCLPNINIILNS